MEYMVLKFCFKVSQSKQNFILFWGVFFQNFQFDPILLRYKRVRQNLKLKKIPANIYWSIFLYLLFNITYTLFSRDHNENNAFKALFCAIPAITSSQLVFIFFNWFIFTWYCNYLFNWLCNILFIAKYTYLPIYRTIANT